MSRHWPDALLWLRVCMSTDLTPEQHVYIPASSPVHRSSHDIVCQSYTVTSYLDPLHVLWQYVVSSPTPLVGLCFHRSKATFQSYDPTPGGILTLVLRQYRPSKISARQVHPNTFEPIPPPCPCLQRADIPTASCPEFHKLAAGLTSGPWATGRGACRSMPAGRNKGCWLRVD